MKKRRILCVLLCLCLSLGDLAWAAEEAPKPAAAVTYDAAADAYTVAVSALTAESRYALYALKPAQTALTAGNLLYTASAAASEDGSITFTAKLLGSAHDADLYLSGPEGKFLLTQLRRISLAVTLPVSAGTRLEGVTVTLTRGEETVAAAVTDANGAAAFYALAPGDYTLALEREGYQSTQVKVSADELATAGVTRTVPLYITLAGTVTVTGEAGVGSVLTAVPALQENAAYDLQWVRLQMEDGEILSQTVIENADGETYTPVLADAGRVVIAQAKGTGDYDGVVASAGVKIPPVPLAGALTVSGNTAVGSALTASIQGLTFDTDYTLQWCHVTGEGEETAFTPIENATGSTYTVTSADRGKTLAARATGAGSYTGVLTSNTLDIPNSTGGGSMGGGNTSAPAPTPTPPPPPAVEVDPDTGAAQLRPEASTDKDGAAQATVDEAAALALTETKPDAVVIAPVVDDNAGAVAVTLSEKAVAALADTPQIRVDAPAAAVTVSGPALAALEGDVSLTTRTQKDGAVSVTVTSGGKAVAELPGGLRVDLPAKEPLLPGAVAVLVTADGGEEVIPKSVVTKNGIGLLLDGSATVKVEDRAVAFPDMKDHWAVDSVAFTSARDLFKGTPDGSFSPATDMSRAMLVTVLYRLEREPDGYTARFDDVAATAWYADAVAWGAQTGVVHGVGTGFAPDEPVTREQLCTMLYRYARSAGLAAGETGALTGFADADDVSAWAVDGVKWAVGAGIITGRQDASGRRIAPAGAAGRAEVAVMLERFTTYLVTGGTGK